MAPTGAQRRSQVLVLERIHKNRPLHKCDSASVVTIPAQVLQSLCRPTREQGAKDLVGIKVIQTSSGTSEHMLNETNIHRSERKANQPESEIPDSFFKARRNE